MLFLNKKLILFFVTFSVILSFFNINPLVFVFVQTTMIYYAYLKQKNPTRYNNKIANSERIKESSLRKTNIAPFENKANAFIELIPIVSFPQKKIVFYSCHLYQHHHFLNDDKKNSDKDHFIFFECLKFLSKESNLDKNIRYMIDLPDIILEDEIYFDLFVYNLQNNTIKNESVVFNIKFVDMQKFSEQIINLSHFNLNFNVYNISVDSIEPLLTGPLASYIFTCQISQSQLLDLMRDELMNERIHSFHSYITRLLVSDVEDLKELESLPNIVDFVSGKCFSKPITIAI